MPIYEYQCKICNYKFEKLQKITDEPLVTCPECSKDGLQKLISPAGFRLAGKGWYETDFKSDNQVKRNIKDNKDADLYKSSSSDNSKTKESQSQLSSIQSDKNKNINNENVTSNKQNMATNTNTNVSTNVNKNIAKSDSSSAKTSSTTEKTK